MENIKRKWYLETWLICTLFALWPLYLIPMVLGIVLLVLKNKEEASLALQMRQMQSENQNLKQKITPEMQDAFKLQELVNSLNEEKTELQSLISDLSSKSEELANQIHEKEDQIIHLDDEISIQEFGLYEPRFNFASAIDYKEELSKIRSAQKDCIKSGDAVSGTTSWSIDGNAKKGRKMVSDTQKLLLRAFNTECDDIIGKVKYTNFDASLNRIYKSSEAISKLGNIMNIRITQEYLDLKIKELRLAFEYQLKKQEEKEAARAARDEQRELAKVQREIEEQQKKLEKEETHYQTAYTKLMLQLSQNPDNADLLSKKEELEHKLSDISKARTDIDYRQANMKAGYVYIISNIGAFGENVYKIGMTRRLDPQERIDELGDASVPFNFDVHAMIFSDDAPALETALHKAFEDRKLNMVNTRREFFRVTLDEIKEVIKNNYDKTIEFIDVPDAEQYRVSQKMRETAAAQ